MKKTTLTFNKKLVETEQIQEFIGELIIKKGWKVEEIVISKEF